MEEEVERIRKEKASYSGYIEESNEVQKTVVESATNNEASTKVPQIIVPSYKEVEEWKSNKKTSLFKPGKIFQNIMEQKDTSVSPTNKPSSPSISVSTSSSPNGSSPSSNLTSPYFSTPSSTSSSLSTPVVSTSVSPLSNSSSTLTSPFFPTPPSNSTPVASPNLSTNINNNTNINSTFVPNSNEPLDTKQKFDSPKILVHSCQAPNRVLQYIKSYEWEIARITPDYVLGKDIGALFLSLRYHLLHPEYISGRIKKMERLYPIKILLCLVDTEENKQAIQDLTRIAMDSQIILMLGWSNQEIARYLETYKAFEKKNADLIKERPKGDHFGKVTDTLTTIKSVNRTDVENLMINFRTLKNICSASMEELALLPGLGEKKVRALHETFHQPFIPPSTIKKQAKINAQGQLELKPKSTATSLPSLQTNNQQEAQTKALEEEEEDIEGLLSLIQDQQDEMET